MPTPEQKKKLLKAKIAVALHDELGRVPKQEEIRATGNLLATPMLIGYARVSTHEQPLNLQQDALTKAGCNKIFTDTASGAKTERKGLDQALNYVRKGDP